MAEEATCKDFLQVQIEGSRKIQRSRRFYDLDAIISVGYRIKSHIATERAINQRKVHFVALGDRHSVTRVGTGERIWYSGTQESTNFAETNSGFALIVDATVIFAKDDVRALSVADRTRLIIPEALDIEITGGAGAESLSRKVAEARHSLERACKMDVMFRLSAREFANLKSHLVISSWGGIRLATPYDCSQGRSDGQGKTCLYMAASPETSVLQFRRPRASGT